MVVGDLDIAGRSIRPPETDPPLIIDPDTVLPDTIALQSFQAVSGRYPQVLQFDSILKESQFPSCDLEKITRDSFDALPLPDTLREPAPETFDHGSY
jgi:hypothetical protein